MEDKLVMDKLWTDPEPVHCDLCGESMKYGLTNCIGMQVTLTGIEDLEKVLIKKFGMKDFSICWVCWIKSLGFKERD